MISGFNTDVKHRGVVYHVQTEDKGVRNPKVETLVYVGGSIIYTKAIPYDEILNTDKQQEIIQAIMEEQHSQIMDDIRKGKFHEGGSIEERPFGFDMISEDKTLDEVVMEYLMKKTKSS